jgi:hypothetical protein
MRVGLGLGVFVTLGTILNFLRVPLDWKIFLILSLIYPLFVLYKKIKLRKIKLYKFKLTKSNLNILIILLIFLASLLMYSGGAFKYPYLEDDDPWVHAAGTKYISIEKTVYNPTNYSLNYLDPYPPGYDLLMGVLHQTNDSVYWTLKFFNGLIISLGIVFFYFFAKLFMHDKNKALFATFVLAAMPSFFTHFIWAHSLVIALFFPAMYCLEMIKVDKKWIAPSSLLIASILFTQPSQSIKLGIMFVIYWLIRAISEKNILKEVLFSGAGGLILSLIWWLKKGKAMFLSQASLRSSVPTSFFEKIKSAFPYDGGTATRVYTFRDFFISKPFGGINVHVGWGIFITLLLIIGLIYMIINYKKLFQKENVWMPISLMWLIFTFLGINSMTFNLPLGLYAFRFWLLAAIPVALISSMGLWYVFQLSRKINFPSIITLLIVIIGIFATSGYQKYNHNTLPSWPPGAFWTSNEEIQGFLWLKTLPPNTKTFLYSTTDKILAGFDLYSCEWCDNVLKFRESILEKDVDQLNIFLKNNNYQYMVISGISYKQLANKFGENETKEKVDNLLGEIQLSSKFSVAHQTKGAIIFKVN